MLQLLDYLDLAHNELIKVVLRDLASLKYLHGHVLLVLARVRPVHLGETARTDLAADDQAHATLDVGRFRATVRLYGHRLVLDLCRFGLVSPRNNRYGRF